MFFEEVGAGLKAEKREWMKQNSLFLGIEHDFSMLAEEGAVPFWPREGITSEIEAMMSGFESTEQCPPGSAAKFRGLNSLAAQAEYGQLGRAHAALQAEAVLGHAPLGAVGHHAQIHGVHPYATGSQAPQEGEGCSTWQSVAGGGQ